MEQSAIEIATFSTTMVLETHTVDFFGGQTLMAFNSLMYFLLHGCASDKSATTVIRVLRRVAMPRDQNTRQLTTRNPHFFKRTNQMVPLIASRKKKKNVLLEEQLFAKK